MPQTLIYNIYMYMCVYIRASSYVCISSCRGLFFSGLYTSSQDVATAWVVLFIYAVKQKRSNQERKGRFFDLF